MYVTAWGDSFDVVNRQENNFRHKVLLIEDDPVLQLVNRKLLELLNCEVDIAANGEQAIAKAKGRYDLIFLDIGLPDISGIDVCKQIRTHSVCRNVPIIVLSAVADLMHDKCIAAGANDTAVKPVLLDGLLQIIKNWVNNANE